MDSRAFGLEFATRVAAELANAIGSATGDVPASRPAQGSLEGDGWSVTLTADGAAGGRCVLWIDRAGAVAAGRAVLMMDEDPDAPTVADLLHELTTQATSAVCLVEPFAGVKIAIGLPQPAALPIGEPRTGFDIDLGARGVTHLAIVGAIEAIIAAPPPAAAPSRRSTMDALDSPNLDVVLDIELPLVVRFGRTVMSLKSLSAIGPGSIVEMGRSPDDPVELLVSDRVIALGEVVIVGGNYGIRITDLVSAADRIRALEA